MESSTSKSMGIVVKRTDRSKYQINDEKRLVIRTCKTNGETSIKDVPLSEDSTQGLHLVFKPGRDPQPHIDLYDHQRRTLPDKIRPQVYGIGSFPVGWVPWFSNSGALNTLISPIDPSMSLSFSKILVSSAAGTVFVRSDRYSGYLAYLNIYAE